MASPARTVRRERLGLQNGSSPTEGYADAAAFCDVHQHSVFGGSDGGSGHETFEPSNGVRLHFGSSEDPDPDPGRVKLQSPDCASKHSAQTTVSEQESEQLKDLGTKDQLYLAQSKARGGEEPLYAQLDCTLQKMRKDHSTGFDMMMAAIADSEKRILSRLRELLDPRRPELDTVDAAAETQAFADSGKGESPITDGKSPRGKSEPSPTGALSADISNSPSSWESFSGDSLGAATSREEKQEKVNQDPRSKSKSKRISDPRKSSKESERSRHSYAPCNIDVKMKEIHKCMMQDRLQRQLSPGLCEVEDSTLIPPSHPCRADDHEDDTCSPIFPAESDWSRRASSYKTNSKSLESLRAKKDSLLTLPELAGPDNERDVVFKAPIEVQWHHSDEGRSCLFHIPWMIFRVFGVIPWRQRSILSSCYSFLMLLLGISATVYPVVQIAQGEMVTMHMSTLPFSVSGLLGALSLRRSFTSQLFSQFPGPLELYSFKHGFAVEFLYGSLRKLTKVVFLLICVIVARGAGLLLTLDDTHWSIDNDPWAFACFLVGSILFLLLLYCQLHVMCMLGMMVDRYCIELFPYPASSQIVLDWNLIQAMLRQIAGSLDFCFLICQTGACAELLMLATRILIFRDMDDDVGCDIPCLTTLVLPPVLLAMGAFSVFFNAASVSEKCSRVAPLVNSMNFEDSHDAFDPQRMQIVNFICSSSAGFYVQEVRITASMAMKLLYVTGLGASALVTKLAADSYQVSS